MPSEQEKTRRWWPQFSLRSLLLVGPLLAIVGAYGGPFCIHAFERMAGLGVTANTPLPPAKMGGRLLMEECVVFRVQAGSNGRLAITTSDGQQLPSASSSLWLAVRKRIAEEPGRDYILLQPYHGVVHEELRKLVNGFAAVAEEMEMQWAVCEYAAQPTMFEKHLKLSEAK